MRHLTTRTLGLAAGLGALSLAAPAMATPFTWNPSAAVSGADGSFTADNATVADYANVVVTPSATGGAATFTENGLVNFSQFLNGGTPVSLPGLDSTYAIYLAFSGTGTQTSPGVSPTPGTTITGAFDTLNYTLFAASGKPTFNASAGTQASVSGLGTPVTIANGSLLSGTTALTNGGSGLSASATTQETLNVVNSGFFTSPPPSTVSIQLNVAFTNTGSVLTTSGGNELVIDGGGGNATISASPIPPPPVPEPASFAVLGAGLLGLVMARRQRLI